MKKQTRNLLLLTLLAAVIIGLRLSGIGGSLTFENLRKNRDLFAAFVQDRYGVAVLLYVLIYISVAALSLPGAAVLTLAGGYLFGTLAAVVYIDIGATAGAVLAFLSARYLLGDRLQRSYSAQLATFNREMERNGVRYLLTLRLIPVFPFFLINFLAGLTRVPLSSFLWTTALGIIPATAVFAFAGSRLESIHTPRDVLSPQVLLAFGALAFLMLVPALWNGFRKKP
jgi:uncharacterized membrane protein YdjX (TVP38/TMEM64 family)